MTEELSFSIELVEQGSSKTATGIGRYTRELYKRFLKKSQQITINLVDTVNLPFSERFTTLQNFPLWLKDHRKGSLVHFPKIRGCSQMLWNPVKTSIATVHDLGILVCKEDELLFNTLDRHILNLHIKGLCKANHYMTNSEKTKLNLMEHLGILEKQITFVQLGVDTNHFKILEGFERKLQDKYAITPLKNDFNLLYVGSELPRKNFGMLLDAIAALKSMGYSLRLIKVGSAGGEVWRRITLEKIEKLKLNDNVFFTGVILEGDLPLFYNFADVCVTPTLLEGGFAWLAMEGMACGKPIVATEAALIPKEAQKIVSVIPDRDLDALITAIKDYLDDETKRQVMGNKGLEIITDYKYSWDKTIEGVLSVYHKAWDN